MTEVPQTYRVQISDLAVLRREKLKGVEVDFTTGHPTLLGDGTLVNIGIAVSVPIIFLPSLAIGLPSS